MKNFFNKCAYYFYGLLLVIFSMNSVLYEYLELHTGSFISFLLITLIILFVLNIYKSPRSNLVVLLLSCFFIFAFDFTLHRIITSNVKTTLDTCNVSSSFKGNVTEIFHDNLYFKNEVIIKTNDGERIFLKNVSNPIMINTTIGDTLMKFADTKIVYSMSGKGYGQLKFQVECE